MFKKLYVVTFDRRTQFIVEARNKKEAREKGLKATKLKRQNAHWYTTNEITSVTTFFYDYFFGKHNLHKYDKQE